MIYCKRLFLSTPSARRATVGSLMTAVVGEKFLSTPSARRATRCECHGTVWRTISIHALREESDKLSTAIDANIKLFLSTPSARRATRPRRSACHHHTYFYPRPPRGERPDEVAHVSKTHSISIHALREESDQPAAEASPGSVKFLSTPSARRATIPGWMRTELDLFLSTPSARRATGSLRTGSDRHRISIHALREESDFEGIINVFSD